MTSSTSLTPPRPEQRPPGDRAGRVLAALCAAATLVPLVGGLVVTLPDTPGDYLMTEGWRTFGYIMFVGLWTLVAVAPRGCPGAWELLLIHKSAVTLFALAQLDLPDAPQTAVIDGIIVLATGIAYVVCRGWRSWQVLPELSRR